MRRFDKEISDLAVIDEILKKSEVCRLGISVDSIPHIIPVNFGYQDNKLYIHSAPFGEKINLIKKNNRVCFEMELESEVVKDVIACNWTTRYRSLIGYGTIQIVSDPEQKVNGMNIIMSKYGGAEKNEFRKSSLNNMVILELEIKSMTAKQSGNWE